MPLYTEVIGSGDIVLDGVAPAPKRGTVPQFLVHVYCGQMVEVDLGPGHIVFGGVPALRKMGTAASPSFRPMPFMATVAHLGYC